MRLKPVNHGKKAGDKNRYCGPSAISAVTGMTTGEAARLLRHVSGRTAIKGTHPHELYRALAFCGIRMQTRIVRPLSPPIQIKGKTVTHPTLAQWLKDTVKERTSDRIFLVVAGHHWQLVSGRRYVCGISGDVVSIRDKKVKRRARVSEVYELHPPRSGKIVIPAQAKERSSPVDPYYKRFRAVVREYGLKYKVYNEAGCKYIQFDPTPFWPDGLDTMHHGWDETHGRVLHCIDQPEAVQDGSYSE